MMGDGVNDAPALKKAEIGISVDNATDVSKEVSDVVLINTDFATIVSAIEEGRNIFQNLRKILTYLIATSFTLSTLILLSVISGLALPLNAVQILWINIIEDGFPGVALGFEKPTKNLLEQPPRGKSESIFDTTVVSSFAVISLVLSFMYFFLYSYLLNNGYELIRAQTIIFAAATLSSMFFLYSVKTLGTSVLSEKIFNNKFVNYSAILGIVTLVLAVYFPPLQFLLDTTALSAVDWVMTLAVSTLGAILIEMIKFIIHNAAKPN
jgi:Ca2+-transporting ATPase